MQQQQQDDDLFKGGGKWAWNCLYAIAGAGEGVIAPFTRRLWGRRFGMTVGLGAVFIAVFAACAEAPEVFYVLYAHLGLCLIHSIDRFRHRHELRQESSRYTGWPWLAIRLPLMRSEMSAKIGGEMFVVCPAIGFAFGAAFQSAPIVALFALAGFLSGVKVAFDSDAERKVAQDALDARIRQRQMLERVKRMEQGDNDF